MMSRLNTMRPASPVSFQNSIGADTRKILVSDRIPYDFHIVQIRPSFALNTQRLLRLRFFVVDENDFPATSPAAGAPGAAGINLMANRGAQDYIVGDGAEGEKDVPVGRTFERGKRVAVDCHNTDASYAHTVDVLVDMLNAEAPA